MRRDFKARVRYRLACFVDTLAYVVLAGVGLTACLKIMLLFFYGRFSWLQIAKQVGAQLVLFCVAYGAWMAIDWIMERAIRRKYELRQEAGRQWSLEFQRRPRRMDEQAAERQRLIDRDYLAQ